MREIMPFVSDPDCYNRGRLRSMDANGPAWTASIACRASAVETVWYPRLDVIDE